MLQQPSCYMATLRPQVLAPSTLSLSHVWALKVRAAGLEDKVSGVTVWSQILILGVSLDQDLHLSGLFLHA